MTPDSLRKIVVNQSLDIATRREAWRQLVQISPTPGVIKQTLEDLDIYASVAFELWSRTGDTPWDDTVANFIGSDTEIKR